MDHPYIKDAMVYKEMRQRGLEKNLCGILYTREEVETITEEKEFFENYHMIAAKSGTKIKSTETKQGYKF